MTAERGEMAGSADGGGIPRGAAVWMISGAFCFAGMAALAHALGPRVGWLTIALARASFMFVAAVIIARMSSARLVLFTPRTLWMRSLAGSFSLVCSFYALTRLPVGEALTLANTYPLWIVGLSWLSLRQKPGWGDLARVSCAVTGVALIEQAHVSGDTWATLVALLGSVSTAVAMIGLHKLRNVDVRAVVAHFAGVATCISGVWFLATGPEGSGRLPMEGSTGAGPGVVAAMLLLGVGLTGTVGQIFLTKAYAAGAPARVAVLGLTQVVFGLGFDMALGERFPTYFSLAGTVLVLVPTGWLLAHSGLQAASGLRAETDAVNGTPSA